jgi:hypothetical protein
MTKESPDIELWKKYISNPDEAIGEDEKRIWMELQCKKRKNDDKFQYHLFFAFY